MPFSLPSSVLLGGVIGLMGQAGDMVMKAIKQDCGAAATGGLLEDDAMDRIDSLCFAAPVFFHLVRYFFVL
jgi:phosphatidate cytidylyltransferase